MNEEKSDGQTLAAEILTKHLNMLVSIPVESMIDNPILLMVVNESVKTCSLTLSLVARI
ncbi:hypothetical protein ACR75V_12845 [Enterococcus avium]|uniref:hypothetical protein n=1 Tax=Enterococcus avium TaxID=33945 RepID=UPI003DA58A65